MSSPADPPGRSRDQLRTALLDYASAPGKYHLAMRQPALLFASIREILQIAAGRETDAGSGPEQENKDVQRAACFFTRTAVLAPGADHYALLGLDRNFEPAELKDRYRLLMRLIHPDFAGDTANAWPADAAVRVNLAHDVLSSSVQRREYDARLAAATLPSPGVTLEHRRSKPPPERRQRSRLKQLAVVCSVAGSSLVLISLFVARPDPVQLVQRGRSPAAANGPAAGFLSGFADATPAHRPQPAPAALAAKLPVQQSEVNEHPRAESSGMERTRESSPPPRLEVAQAPSPPVREVVPVPPLTPEPAPVGAVTRLAAPVAAAPAPPPAAAPAVALSAPPTPLAPPVPVLVANAAPAPPGPSPAVFPAPLARATPVAGVSLADAQPLLADLLQRLEGGRGDRLISLLDRDARNKPGAQALSRHYDGLVEGMQPVRLSQVEFKAEPAGERLLVIGHVFIHVGEQTIGTTGKKIVLRAEFATREGMVVMTGLSGVAGN